VLPEAIQQLSREGALRALVRRQKLMGIGAWSSIVFPFLRRVHGLGHLDPARRFLMVSNHVSLLDTILLGGLCWRHKSLPILVLGDRNVWQASWVRRALSGPIGFLLERGKLNPSRIRELQAFARAGAHCNLVVFPEGTRGDGLDVGPLQPGIYYIAREAKVPILPIFIQNMQRVSTKSGRFHPVAGLRRVEVHIGEPVPPKDYLGLERDAFTEFLRDRIRALRPRPQEVHSTHARPPG